MKLHLTYTLLIVFAAGQLLAGAGQEWQVTSPNGETSAIITHTDKGAVIYSIPAPGETDINLINASSLGLERADAVFKDNLSLVSASDIRPVHDQYHLVAGKRSQVEVTGNELQLVFANPAGQQIGIIFRAYNDGIAFCYQFDNDKTSEYTIQDEYTIFAVNPNGVAWMQQYDWWSPPYERLYENKIWIGKVSPRHREDGWSYPALFNIAEHWMLITESNLDGSYCATHIRNREDSPVYKVELATREMGYRDGPIHPAIHMPWQSPWRVIMLGDLGTLVESTLVQTLAAPSQLQDTDWIAPGKSSWSWLYATDSPRDYDALQDYVDLSARMGWAYSLVDANWNEMSGGSVEQLADYAASKNVGLFLWYNSGGKHNTVTEQPRDILSDPVRRKEEFARISKLGIAGIKVDFFNSDKQDIIQLYIDILQDAAEHKLLVNFHGCTLPRGWSRTWPNMITLEAVKGAESYLTTDEEFIYQAGRHHAILPFTRNIVGPMDYTPVNFSPNRMAHVTSYGHELALALVFQSGVLHMGDVPEAYLSLPQAARDFLATVPTAWDETRYLAGYPGKDIILARRHDDNWYIGGINGYFDDKEFTLDLSFLGDHEQTFTVVRDGKDKQAFEVETVTYPETSTLTIKTLPEGGFVLYPEQD